MVDKNQNAQTCCRVRRNRQTTISLATGTIGKRLWFRLFFVAVSSGLVGIGKRFRWIGLLFGRRMRGFHFHSFLLPGGRALVLSILWRIDRAVRLLSLLRFACRRRTRRLSFRGTS